MLLTVDITGCWISCDTWGKEFEFFVQRRVRFTVLVAPLTSSLTAFSAAREVT